MKVVVGQKKNTSLNWGINVTAFLFVFPLKWFEIVLLSLLCGWSLFQMSHPHHTSFPHLKGWSSSSRKGDRWPGLPESSVQCRGSILPRHPGRALPRLPEPRHHRPPPVPHPGCCGNSTPTQWWRLWQQCSWKTFATFISVWPKSPTLVSFPNSLKCVLK